MARAPSTRDTPLYADASVMAEPGRGLVLDPAGPVADRSFRAVDTRLDSSVIDPRFPLLLLLPQASTEAFVELTRARNFAWMCGVVTLSKRQIKMHTMSSSAAATGKFDSVFRLAYSSEPMRLAARSSAPPQSTLSAI